MKVVVTGGAGFIGSHLVDRLIGEKWEVMVIDNLSSGRKEFINKNSEFHVADLSQEDVSHLLKGVDMVFHLAANPDVA